MPKAFRQIKQMGVFDGFRKYSAFGEEMKEIRGGGSSM
jgi:hypothetical protein